MNVIWLILNLSTAIQLAETVSVAGHMGQHGPHWSHQYIKLDCFSVHGATLSACSKNRYMWVPMWNVQHSLAMVSLIIYKQTQKNNEMPILLKKHVSY